MKIDKTVVMEEKDIFQAIKDYLAKNLAIPEDTICSFQLCPLNPDYEPSRDEIKVIIQQEKV
jgi:hypothetical protein